MAVRTISDGFIQRRMSANQEAFLAAYARLGNITAASKATGVVRGEHYYWLKNDPDGAYLQAFENAHEDFVDALEEAAVAQAKGLEEPFVTPQGKLVTITDPETGEERPLMRKVLSPSVMIALLKGHRRRVFGDKIQQEISGRDGGPIEVAAVRQLVEGEVSSVVARIGAPEVLD